MSRAALVKWSVIVAIIAVLAYKTNDPSQTSEARSSAFLQQALESLPASYGSDSEFVRFLIREFHGAVFVESTRSTRVNRRAHVDVHDAGTYMVEMKRKVDRELSFDRNDLRRRFDSLRAPTD